MYILLCGYPPFNAQNDNEIYALIRRGKFYFDPLEWDVVSDSAKDLVTKMLTMDPSQRPSAQEVIEHPWIQASIKKEKVDMPILSRALNRLHNFNATTKLQIAVSSFITSQLAEKEEVEQLKKTFTLLDVNKDGLLSKKELMEGFNRAMNLMMTEDELEEIMRSVDADGSGYVEYDEFIRSTVKKSTMLNQRNLEIAFNTFDTDRSGSISASEVKMILGQGNDVDNSFFETIIKEVDLDGNNEIDIREFKEMMFKMYNMDENRDEPVSATLEKLNTLSAN